MNELDIVLESYETTSEIYRSDMENSIVCESLCLPAEEGVVDAVKKTVTAIYDKFKRLVAAFKKWVKSIIARIKAFFRKGKKKDEPAPDTDSSDSKSSEPPSSVKVTQEDAKEDVSKLQNIIKQADAVETSLKKASTGEVTPEEAKDLNKQADDAASEMKEAKKTMEVKYLILPANSESGNTKDTETDQSLEERHNNYLKALNDSKDSKDPAKPTASDFAGMNKVVSEIASKDPFKLGDADYKDRGATWQFISRCGEIEAGGKKSFGWINASVRELVRRILRVMDSENPNYKSAQLMLSYMQSKIPSQLQKYINSNKNQVAKLKKGLANYQKKPLDVDKYKEYAGFAKAQGIQVYTKEIFEGEPNMQNLKKFIKAKEQTNQS